MILVHIASIIKSLGWFLSKEKGEGLKEVLVIRSVNRGRGQGCLFSTLQDYRPFLCTNHRLPSMQRLRIQRAVKIMGGLELADTFPPNSSYFKSSVFDSVVNENHFV